MQSQQSAKSSSAARATQHKMEWLQYMVFFFCCMSQVHGFAPPVCVDAFGAPASRQLFRENRMSYQRRPAIRMLSGPFSNVFGLLNKQKQDSAREEAKSQLMEVVRRKQSRSNRVETEQILERLVESNKKDTKAFKTSLSGNWRLLWSSQTADANPWQTPASVLGGDCYQVVDETGGAEGPRVENVVVWPLLGNLTLRGSAALKRVSETECIITINSFTLELGGLLLPLLKLTDSVPIAVKDVAQVRSGSQLVTVESKDKKERVLNRREGSLKLLYLDREGLRVSQGDNSLLYVHQREQ